MRKDLLLKRLDEIARSLEKSGHALALLGLGSVGLEQDRMDEYSDLDFFVIVEQGYKQGYMDNLGWLSAAAPIAYSFANTRDGYKVLYADGIFCEFAVFEPDELKGIPFAPGRIIWKQSFVPNSISQPVLAQPPRSPHDIDWLLGEALTNLLVGLAREKRGEKLSAMRFIQGHAVDRVLELAGYIEKAQDSVENPFSAEDPFSNERRFEQRYPVTAGAMSAFLQGYERNRESALAVLAFLEAHFPVNGEIAVAIRSLCKD